MSWLGGKNEPVQEAAPLRGRVEEQTILGRGEPHGPQQLGQVAGGCRLPFDAHATAEIAGAFQSGSDPSPVVTQDHIRRHRPGPPDGLTWGPAADLRQGRSPKPSARREEA